MDIFGRFARDPACLVALDAADGGTWRSSFRPGLIYPVAPSGGGGFEEKAGLIAKSNVKTSNGYFERERATGSYLDTNWHIKTPYFIHGSTQSHTFVVRCLFFDHSVPGTWNYRRALGDADNLRIEFNNQTGNTAGGPSQRFGFYARLRNSADTADLTLPFEITDWETMASYLNRWMVLVMVVDFIGTYPALRAYVDGVLVGSFSGNFNYSKKFCSIGPTVPICVGAQNITAPAYKNGCEKVSNILVFDRALSIGEIQLLR